MTSTSSKATGAARPSAFSTKSFTRFEPSASAPAKGHRHRASTLESTFPSRISTEQEREDVFNKTAPEETSPVTPDLGQSQTLPDNFDELPVELVSLTDRFIESLGQRAFEQPPSIDQIAELFQEFYIRASASISIHVSSLISRLNRDTSPKPSRPLGKSRTFPNKPGEDVPTTSSGQGAQQMLTANEVTEKRKARKLLGYKRVLLEEAVERRVCEKVYRKIWRHKSTLDEVQDEKLRSKTAALALVGIGLKDLGIDLTASTGKTAEDVQELLLPARDGLMRMNEEKCPLGKLQHLTKAHKAIVDTLYSIHGSSSSADEILPTLIYTLITSPVEGINIISNLNFIQRFRAASKIDGEAAYCMTNLEAAISFLENVDLSTLRADELPEGPKKAPSQPETPILEKRDPFPSMSVIVDTTSPASTVREGAMDAQSRLKATIAPDRSPSSPRHQRTLSDLLQPVAAANEAVRLKANEGIENIANTLDNSFKFLFGRLKEQAADPASPKDMIVPKTLDEAMQLVSKDPGLVEDQAATSETSSIADKELSESAPTDRGDKILSLFGGKKPVATRDRSVDSQRSNTSSRRVTFGAVGTPSDVNTTPKDNIITTPSIVKPLDSVKNLGTSLNPFANIGNALGAGFGRFGRPSMPTSANPISPVSAEHKKDRLSEPARLPEGQREITVDASPAIASKIRTAAPPIRRFLETDNSSELRIGDVADLLEDYKRIASLLSEIATNEQRA